MKKKDIKEQINKLIQEIIRHDRLYYMKSDPEISDAEYDTLLNELLRLEKEYPDLKRDDSPTSRIGSDINNEFPTVEHTIPVLSLDKAYSFEEIERWLNKRFKQYREFSESSNEENKNGPGDSCEKEFTVSIEEKIDGLSVLLYYDNGILQKAVTRGDGIKGNNITRNVKTIRSIPLTINSKNEIAVRGEIYIKQSDFTELNNKYDGMYANPRNLASGVTRRKFSSEVAGIPLKIFIYEGFEKNSTAGTYNEIITRLEDYHFSLTAVKFFTKQFNFKNSDKEKDGKKATELFDNNGDSADSSEN
ncbi:MAG: hypothetical protein KAS39_01630, partial [Actinomycetia bacterium]|nr:hypothetical protein [Actinomycetes bacterium]